MSDTETKSVEYKSKKSALESAFDAAIASGAKTRIGVKEAPSLEGQSRSKIFLDRELMLNDF